MEEHKQDIIDNGFTVVNNIFTAHEVELIIAAINNTDTSNPAFRKSNELFAIRQFLKEVPATQRLIFSDKLISLIRQLFGHDYFVTKSIYFDKP